MEYTTLILPQNICRTCLVESDSTCMNVQDSIEHEMNKIKLIDILIFLNCVENNDEDNWPQEMCSSCVDTAILSYNFKLNCLKANLTLSQVFTIQSTSINLQGPQTDSIDINVVYQDHEYDTPLYSNHAILDYVPHASNNKELTPLPPVTEITSTEHPPRKVGEKKYSCNVCSKSFTRVFGLQYHMAKHRDFRRYLCSKCGKSFHVANGLRQHLLTHKEVPQFKCGFCNKTYKLRQSLKEHFRKAHSSNRKLFTCVTCDKSFTAKSTLMMHIKTHTGEKQYSCPNCPKTYTRASYLRVHSLIHSNQDRPRPFQCKFVDCNRSFPTKQSLSIHTAHAHSSARPHKCVICYKGFPTLSGLKTHSQSHMNNEIDCHICGKKLSSKRVLQKHMKVHNVNDDLILESVVDLFNE